MRGEKNPDEIVEFILNATEERSTSITKYSGIIYLHSRIDLPVLDHLKDNRFNRSKYG